MNLLGKYTTTRTTTAGAVGVSRVVVGPWGGRKNRTGFPGLRRSAAAKAEESKYQAARFPLPVVEGKHERKRSLYGLLDMFKWGKAGKNSCLVKETSGFMDFHDHQLFYRIFHPPKSRQSLKAPVLVLHGGPQIAHNYLENVGQLAFLGHPVIMFDQSGCGLSGSPKHSSIISIEYLRDQVAFVMDELSLGEVHLLGHSAGGVLALEYTRAYPESILSLTLCSTPSDVRVFLEEAALLMKQLPLEAQHVISTSWDHTEDAYKKAIEGFNKRFLCRLAKWPESLLKSFEMAGTTFRGVRAISSWRISKDELAKIDIPVLNISGQYDEVTPRCIKPLHEGLPLSEWVLFEDSAHMPFLEEPGKFVNTMAKFLARADPGSGHNSQFYGHYA